MRVVDGKAKPKVTKDQMRAAALEVLSRCHQVTSADISAITGIQQKHASSWIWEECRRREGVLTKSGPGRAIARGESVLLGGTHE